MDSLAKVGTSGFMWLIDLVCNFLFKCFAVVEMVLIFSSLCNVRFETYHNVDKAWHIPIFGYNKMGSSIDLYINSLLLIEFEFENWE